MPRPLATLRCTIPARKSLSKTAAKRKHKRKKFKDQKRNQIKYSYSGAEFFGNLFSPLFPKFGFAERVFQLAALKKNKAP